jgi:hypothetical protein
MVQLKQILFYILWIADKTRVLISRRLVRSFKNCSWGGLPSWKEEKTVAGQIKKLPGVAF